MIKIIYFSANPEKTPSTGYWDHALLADLLKAPIFKTSQAKGGAIVIVPAPYQGEYIEQINNELSKYTWVLLFLTSDEEGKFPVELIKHPNIRIWVQYPKQGRHDKYGKLPLGYTTETRKNLVYTDKPLDLYFSGQVTHERRKEMWKYLIESVAFKGKNTHGTQTEGFAQGDKPSEYMASMCDAKVAPAPAGTVSADSFRAYEALEAGAVPIVDQLSGGGDILYFDYLFDNPPFPRILNYENLPGYIEDALKRYPAFNNECQAWWLREKRDLLSNFIRDIEQMTDLIETNPTTVIIPVSPIKSHPSTKILDETIMSIRHHLPDSEILITFDGVREEQEHMRKDYEEFTRKALFLCNTKWRATPYLFKEHTHQVGMARKILEEVKTPIILYCEQDTPLVTDEQIEWERLEYEIMMNRANVIRFHFEAVIPEEHKKLMIDQPENGLLRTVQWSQRPHLASTSFYKYFLARNFSENAKCFIEDKIHGVIQDDYNQMGMRGWDLWKLFIYYPDEKNIKRSLNLDGREGEEKYDDRQVF